MPLFLVTGKVERTLYEGRNHVTTETRLVQAKDEFEASAKFERHFESKSSQYAVSYMVYDATAHEVIE